MKYRPFGKLDWQVSVLGIGGGRLPLVENDYTKIDEQEAVKVIRHCIDKGVNIIDTAQFYNDGMSEITIGKALLNGYRQKIKIVTKLPCFLVNDASDFDRFLNQQLQRLQTDYIDFYLLQALNKEIWPKMCSMGIPELLEKAIEDSRIRHTGFSFHDDVETFEKIVDARDTWALCMIQYNFMDRDFQAGNRGLKYAASKGLAVTIMEPLRGGHLAKKPPEPVAKVWAGAEAKRSPADWSLQWLWNHPEISVVFSGMSSMQDAEENLASVDRSGPRTLSEPELLVVDRARDAFRSLIPIPCTTCNYCIPCPNGVDIPRAFELYNDGFMYEDHRRSRMYYRMQPLDKQGCGCTNCGECLERCTQQISIPEWLEKVHSWLGPRK